MAPGTSKGRSYIPKRVYWLKLFAHYLSEPRMRMLGTMGLGSADSFKLMWLEVLLLCLQENMDEGEIGFLRVSPDVPYDWATLAGMLQRDVNQVRGAFEAFSRLKMVEILPDGTIYVEEIHRLIGSRTDTAERMKKHRDEKKKRVLEAEAATPPDVTMLQHDVTLLRNIERDVERDLSPVGGDKSLLLEHQNSTMAEIVERPTVEGELRAFMDQLKSEKRALPSIH